MTAKPLILRSAVTLTLMSYASVLLASGLPSQCTVSEADFVGSWSTPVGDNIIREDAHVIEFSKIDGRNVFSSWLHHRPEASDQTWRFEGCHVIVPDGMTKLRYSFATDGTGRLVQGPIFSNAPFYERVE